LQLYRDFTSRVLYSRQFQKSWEPTGIREFLRKEEDERENQGLFGNWGAPGGEAAFAGVRGYSSAARVLRHLGL
jgi:hypothetical protein